MNAKVTSQTRPASVWVHLSTRKDSRIQASRSTPWILCRTPRSPCSNIRRIETECPPEPKAHLTVGEVLVTFREYNAGPTYVPASWFLLRPPPLVLPSPDTHLCEDSRKGCQRFTMSSRSRYSKTTSRQNVIMVLVLVTISMTIGQLE